LTRVLLVLNAGSSSIKFSLFEVGERAATPALLVRGEVDGLGARPRFVAQDKAGARVADDQLAAGATHDDAFGTMLAWIEARTAGAEVIAAGHRVVHGGVGYASPVRVTPEVMQELEALVPLAPLHQPHNLEAIKALAKRRPALPQVACFDTAFHITQPAVAQAIALPRSLGEAASSATGSTVSPTSTSRACCLNTWMRGPMAASWWPTWVREPRCAPCAAGKAWRRRWASPRSTGWSWARARERSTRECSFT